MGFSFGSKSNTVAIFDIGSGSVGVCLVKTSEEKPDTKPTILFSKRVYMKIEDELNFPIFLETMLKTVADASSLLANSGLQPPKTVHCFLHTPWYVSHSRTIHTEKNIPFTITNSFVQQAIQTEIDIFLKSEFVNYKPYKDMDIIEKYATNSKINGYSIENPIGKKGSIFDISIFLSLTPKKITNDIKLAIEKNISLADRNIHFHSNICATYGLIRDMFINLPDYLLIDVGGEITDLAIVKDNILMHSASFPSGQNTLVRSVMQAYKYNQQEAFDLLTSTLTGHMDTTTSENLEEVVKPVRNEWLKDFQNLLVTLSNNVSLPHNVFLVSESSLTLWYTDCVKREEFSQYMLTEKKFSVTAFAAPSVYEYCEFEKNISEHDYALIVYTLTINKLHKFLTA
ncbi:MAG: hypothetical protein ACR2IQ_01160 [Minisyncoccia bacterium]